MSFKRFSIDETIFFLVNKHINTYKQTNKPWEPSTCTTMSLRKTVYNVANVNETYAASGKSPDEVLGRTKPDSIELVPVKFRDYKNEELPDSDLLNALHYYVSHTHPNTVRYFDETSLLTMGLLADQWIEELFNDNAHNIYAEFKNQEDRKPRIGSKEVRQNRRERMNERKQRKREESKQKENKQKEIEEKEEKEEKKQRKEKRREEKKHKKRKKHHDHNPAEEQEE